MRGRLWIVLLIACGTLACGCAQKRACQGGCPTGGQLLAAALPEVLRGSQAEAIHRLEHETAFAVYQPDVPGSGYRYFALSAAQCQCLAVEASDQGNLLAAERRTMTAQARQRHQTRAATAAVNDVLLAAEREARNASALAALLLYYGLVEAEQRLDQVWLSEQAVSEVVGEVEVLRQSGLPLAVDDSMLTSQQLQLQSRRIEIEATIDRLNSQLRTRLGLVDPDGDARFWPTEPLAVDSRQIDAAPEIAAGLAERHELVGIRRLARQLDAETLVALRMLLLTSNPLLGNDNSLLLPLLARLLGGKRADEREVADRRRQLQQLLAQREASLSEEIRVAVQQRNWQSLKVGVHREQLSQAREQLTRVESELERGEAHFGDRLQARTAVWQAEAELISETSAWYTAGVRLAHLQGRLLTECCQRHFHPAALDVHFDFHEFQPDESIPVESLDIVPWKSPADAAILPEPK